MDQVPGRDGRDKGAAVRPWAAQPCVIVNDIKFGDSEGAVALFVGPGTEGYFANLKITQ
jgi:hypothetical protein